MYVRRRAMLGPYRLVERTEAVGLAEVWTAYHAGLRRYVVAKVLLPHLVAQPGYLERFRHEAPAISRLDHPNILHVHDFGEQDGFTYLITPLVSGLTLDFLLGEAWPPAEAALVLEPLASALDYAHARRIVHRDLKPTNVLITDDGQVILDGYGAGWIPEGAAVRGRDALARAGRLIGRTRHLAPEWAEGQPLGPAADRYALGTIAFELLTGRPPFEVEVWPAELEPPSRAPSPLPCSLSSSLPMPIVAVLHRAMARHPDDRFPTAGALVRALLAADEPAVVEPPAGPAERPVAVQTLPPPPEPSRPPFEWPEEPGWRDRLQAARDRVHTWGWKRSLGGVGAALLVMLLFQLFVVKPSLALLGSRGNHGAVLLSSGEVLVAGGCTNTWSSNPAALLARNVRWLGARDAERGWLDTSVLYSTDPGGSGWMLAAHLLQPRCDPRLQPLPGGKALVVGAGTVNGQPATTAERYDRASNYWAPAGKLSIARKDYAITPLANGQVLVVGGVSPAGGDPLASAERYDPATNNWSLVGSLAQARTNHTATLLSNGQVLVVGGTVGKVGALASVERFDPASNGWTRVASLQQARTGHTATLLADGQVLVVGGSGERSRLASAERYDPVADTWTRVGVLSQARLGHTATLLADGQVLVAAGSGLNGDLASAERFDPAANTWLAAGTLSQARSGHTASLLPSGQVLVVGGRRESDESPYLNTAELYDPVANRWTSAPDLPP